MTHSPIPSALHEEAVAWVVRTGDAAFDDWAGFEAWLGASPAHAEAYHDASIAEADMVAVLAAAPRPLPAPVERRTRRRWLPLAGTALAASIVGVLLWQAEAPAPPVVYETAPGTHRAVALADGSKVLLNGDTRLVAERGDPRSLTLARGEALFSVRHDAAHPFRVAVGKASIVDVGTRFDVVRDRDGMRVAVSEGAVDWRQGADTIRLTAGRWLRLADGSANVELGGVAVDAVGGWSQGQLFYEGTPLAEVAADLSRNLGTTVTVAPAIARQPVRGTLSLQGGAEQAVPRLAALLGLRATRDGQQWRLIASP